LFFRRICSSIKYLVPRRWFDEAAVAEKPSTDERTGTRGCGQDPGRKGDGPGA
jgi:hypothetical protein